MVYYLVHKLSVQNMLKQSFSGCCAVTLAEDKDSQRDLNLAQPRRRAVQ
jgi:hypothetical protein